MSRPKRGAWVATYEPGGYSDSQSEVVYATTERGAQIKGLHALQFRDVQVWRIADIDVRREPDFDPYMPGPVPKDVLLRHGWWFDCGRLGCALPVLCDDYVAFANTREVYHARCAPPGAS